MDSLVRSGLRNNNAQATRIRYSTGVDLTQSDNSPTSPAAGAQPSPQVLQEKSRIPLWLFGAIPLIGVGSSILLAAQSPRPGRPRKRPSPSASRTTQPSPPPARSQPKSANPLPGTPRTRTQNTTPRTASPPSAASGPANSGPAASGPANSGPASPDSTGIGSAQPSAKLPNPGQANTRTAHSQLSNPRSAHARSAHAKLSNSRQTTLQTVLQSALHAFLPVQSQRQRPSQGSSQNRTDSQRRSRSAVAHLAKRFRLPSGWAKLVDTAVPTRTAAPTRPAAPPQVAAQVVPPHVSHGLDWQDGNIVDTVDLRRERTLASWLAE
jgi:hypothetical protein